MKTKKQKILVAMSGGVDSSVAAAILKKQNYDITGVFMINWHEQQAGHCPWENEYQDAQAVANKLNIKLFTWDFSQEYKKYVFDYFINAYKQGLTPNPDTLCNKIIKFGSFLDKAMALGFDKIATGHYARLKKTSRGYQLFEANDKSKDQTYFLYELNQKQLAKTIFPLAKIKKQQVRRLAHKLNLPVDTKKDSYGICYIGEKNMSQFLGQFIKKQPGDIVDKNGCKLGCHSGLHNYTLGQRQRIGIGGIGPFYVLKKNLNTNQLIVTNNTNDPDLYSTEIYVKNVNWLTNKVPNLPNNYLIRYRHLGQLHPATIFQNNNSQLKIVFKKPVKTIVPGQAAVFYTKKLLSKNHQLLGGAIIV